MKRHAFLSSMSAACIALSLGVSAGVAKTVVLRSGRQIRADVIRQDEQAVILDLGRDVLRIPRAQIQAIRSEGKTPEDPITSDPLFRYAHESLPAQASVYLYRNDRLNAEAIWTTLRQMARETSTQDGGSSDPVLMGMREIKKYVDLGKLPEFKAVEKYWGASVGYMQSRPEGLYWETATLRPQQQ